MTSGNLFENINETSSTLYEDLSNISGELYNDLTNTSSALSSLLSAEIIERTNNDNYISGALTSTSAELYNNLSSTSSHLITIINETSGSLNDVINTETENRIIADEYLSGVLISTSAELYNDLSSTSSHLISVINETSNIINTEIENRITADNYLSGTIESVSSTLFDDLSSTSGALLSVINQERIDRISAISDEASLRDAADIELGNRITDEISGLNNLLDSEISARQLVDTNLQSQIDTIEATQNVIDLVGTYAALTAYNTSAVKAHDKIQVITDETSGNQSTIYSWENNAWSGIGMFGPYYTKSQVDEIHRTNNLTVNYSDEIVTISIG